MEDVGNRKIACKFSRNEKIQRAHSSIENKEVCDIKFTTSVKELYRYFVYVFLCLCVCGCGCEEEKIKGIMYNIKRWLE